MIGGYLKMSAVNILTIKSDYSYNIKYIPINLNIMIYQNSYDIVPYVNINIIKNIKSKVTISGNYSNDFLIFDFAKTNINSDKVFLELFTSDILKYRIILSNIETITTHKSLITALESIKINYQDFLINKNHYIVLNSSTSIEDVNNLICECNNYIVKQIKNICFMKSNKTHYLSNSNLYIKDYFNVKNLFSDNDLFAYTVNKMCEWIVSNFQHVDALICSSNNGAVLCNIIGDLLNKKSLFAFNIGPNLSIKDIEDLDKIEKDKKYIYIFDFMCIGTEYKIIQTITRIKKAFICASVGVGVYLTPNRNKNHEKIYRLVNVDSSEYKVSFYEEDLK